MSNYYVFFDEVLKKLRAIPGAGIEEMTNHGNFSTSSGKIKSLNLIFYCDDNKISIDMSHSGRPKFFEVKINPNNMLGRELLDTLLENLVKILPEIM
jgi:hypothetical protein